MVATGSGLESWEYPKGSGIRIRALINLNNGESYGGSYQVALPAEMTGKKGSATRKRKQFKRKLEAEKWAEKQWSSSKKQGADYFRASDSERREFVQALPEIRMLNGGLGEAVKLLLKLESEGLDAKQSVEFAIRHLKPAGGIKTLDEVIDELLRDKDLRLASKTLSEYTHHDFKVKSGRLSKSLGSIPVNEIDKDRIKNWLGGLGRSPRTVKNYLACLSEVLRHAKESDYIVESPLVKLTSSEKKVLIGVAQEKQPEILTLKEVNQVLNSAHEHVELGFLPLITLGLFCGIRTVELGQLDWSDVKDGEERPFVTISHAIAKKRRIRHVDIPDNALSWLSLCKNREGRIAHAETFKQHEENFRKFLIQAGFMEKDDRGRWRSNWKRNALRHSFASYHYALHGNSLETARLLGHKASDQVLFDHYRALATKEQGEAFFSIVPPKTASKLVEFAG